MGDELAAVLRRHRKRAGLTQEALAERSGVSVRTIRGIEIGKRRNPQLASVRQLAEALELSAAELNELLAATGAEEPAGVVPRQLPSGVAGFVGRANELDRLDALLDNASALLISAVSGTAGVGKTALAVHWAHRVADRFPDGQLYANLRGFDPGAVVAPAEVLRGFLEALGVVRLPATLGAQVGLYRSLMAGRRVLVVLDNVRDAEQVRPLLPGAAGCLVVVTSRNQLTSLVAINNATPLLLDLLGPAEAEELLAGRLGRDRLAAEPEAVAQIISLCARLPLALAVVAARAATRPAVPLSALVTELRDLDGLTGAEPSADVRSVFSWSYRALSPEAARVFRLLGLHWGAEFGLASVASLAGLSTGATRRLLAELAEAHLITEQQSGRYTFHDLLRGYAAELSSTSDNSDALARLLDHYLHTGFTAAMRYYPQRRPIDLPAVVPGVVPVELADRDQALAWFAEEHPTVLAAADHALAHGQLTHAWQLAWTLLDFLDRAGQRDEQLRLQRIALAAADELGDPEVQAYAHRALGRAYSRIPDYPRTYAHFDAALALLRGDLPGESHLHLSFAAALQADGRFADALAHATTAHELAIAAGDRLFATIALGGIGWSHAQLGHLEQALEVGERALAGHVELGTQSSQADVLDTLGFVHLRLGHHAEAIDCYRRSAVLYRELGDPVTLIDTLVNLGEAQLAAGDTGAAREAWREALGLLESFGQPEADDLRARLAALS